MPTQFKPFLVVYDVEGVSMVSGECVDDCSKSAQRVLLMFVFVKQKHLSVVLAEHSVTFMCGIGR